MGKCVFVRWKTVCAGQKATVLEVEVQRRATTPLRDLHLPVESVNPLFLLSSLPFNCDYASFTYVVVIQCQHAQLREDWESIKGSFAQKIVTRNQTTQFGELTDVFKITIGDKSCSRG